MTVIIVFYTKEPKPPEIYYTGNVQEMEKFTTRIAELTNHKAKFAVYQVGECVGDFS
jgi:hypothetical protein